MKPHLSAPLKLLSIAGSALFFSLIHTQGLAAATCKEWKEGDTFKVGDIITYKNKNYKNIQAHTAYIGTGWTPPLTPALWAVQANNNCSSTPAPALLPAAPLPTHTYNKDQVYQQSANTVFRFRLYNTVQSLCIHHSQGSNKPDIADCDNNDMTALEWQSSNGKIINYKTKACLTIQNTQLVTMPSCDAQSTTWATVKGSFKIDERGGNTVLLKETESGQCVQSMHGALLMGKCYSAASLFFLFIDTLPTPKQEPSTPPKNVDGIPTGTETTLNNVKITWYACDAPVCYPAYSNLNPGFEKLPYDKYTEGTGSADNPGVFAIHNARSGQPFPIGTLIYAPLYKKYFILQDECSACSNALGALWIDFFQGPTANANTQAHIACADIMSNIPYNATIIVNPPKNLPVETTRVLDDNNQCTGKKF